MRAATDRLTTLVSHGLSQYEARVYLALLDFPSASAGTLAKASQVPRNRLYEVVESLHAVGLVDILIDRPAREYRARPFSAYLDRQVADLKGRVADLEAKRSEATLEFRPPALADPQDIEVGATRALTGRRAVAREMDRLIGSARSSLAIASSAGGAERVGRYLAPHAEALAGIFKEGSPDLEIYLPRRADGVALDERVRSRLGWAVRWMDVALNSVTLIVDDAELLIVHPIPDDEKPTLGRDFALHSTDRALARDHLELLRRAVGPRVAPKADERA